MKFKTQNNSGCIANMLSHKAFAALLCFILAFAFQAKAQVEFGDDDSIPISLMEDEIEPDSIPWLDVLMQGNTQTIFDSSFNYNFINGLATDSLHFRAGLLYDLETNTIVWQKDMNYAYPIASVTKVMTALLAVQDIQSGRIGWNDRIELNSKQVVYTGSRRHRKKKTVNYHSTYTLRDLLKMTMIESNNYAAALVGKYCGGDNLDAFIKRMNEKALELKMHNTFYSNPSGLPAAYSEMDNSSSPHDLLLLAKEALKYPELMEIASMGYAAVENGHSTYTIRNHNGLVRDYVNEVDGLKTGFTRSAGFCLAATAKRYDHRLVAIVLGFNSVWTRNNFIAALFNNYYQHIGLGTMGTMLTDSALEAVRPGYCNSDFNFSAVARKVPASVKNEFTNENTSSIVYKTVTQQVRRTHVVKKGETLTKIANKYDVTSAELKKWNNLKSTTVRKGQKLTVVVDMKKVVPVKVDAGSNLAAREELENKTSNNDSVKADADKNVTASIQPAYKTDKSYIIHTVQRGDTLWNIAQRYKLDSIDGIKKLNRITKNQIKVGQKVKVPVA